MKHTSKKLDERGIVSMMVTFVMMIIITLIVIGFAQVARRNQSEALDRQLSSQAFYAAESGVNDVIDLFHMGKYNSVNDPLTDKDSTVCNNFQKLNPSDPTLGAGASTNVEYTCVLVDQYPTSNVTQTVPVGSSNTYRFKLSDELSKLDISYDPGDSVDTDPSHCPATAGQFPPAGTAAGTWRCSFGLLRLDITRLPTNLSASVNPAQDLASSTSTIYIQPTTTDTTPTIRFGTATQAYLSKADCGGGTCNTTLNFAPGAGLSFGVRISTLYATAKNITLTPHDLDPGDPVNIQGGQVIIDSTGRAADVTRRIQERVNISPTNSAVTGGNPAPSALSSTADICKRFVVGLGPQSSTCTY